MTDKRRKLLIIDDDALVRRSVAVYLDDSGFDVVEAADATQLASAIQDSQPELVITDLRMPGADGLQVLQQLKQSQPLLPVILMSGAGSLGDVVRALRYGASDYLIKPILDIEILVHAIHRALERRDLLVENQRYREQLENANSHLRESLRVLERDQMAGKQVQKRLMPTRLLTRDHYLVEHYIAPSLYLSGDFIDYAHIKKRYLAFYLTDVSGHGSSSAFVTIWLKHLVSRMVREEELFNGEMSFATGTDLLLQTVNQELHETRLNHHLTFFVGVIDTHTQVMNYSVAGHLPMPIIKTEDGVRYLEGMGKPVGIFKDVSWQVYSMQLPPVFSLNCFSDGVLEILPGETIQEKEAQLLQKVLESSGSLESVCNTLQVKDDGESPDDIAILTISRGK
ncbi:MAG TPA: SpoIIE family protein phosphatase [Cellvibrio sp.]|nr:SpoIIE family protein phosphatase [Cellvibrio sp.]